MATANKTIHQYEPIRAPSRWGDEERKLILQLKNTFDDIYRRFGRLRYEDFGAEMAEAIDAAIALDAMTTAGDMVYRNATAPTRLALGTEGKVLKSGATAPTWVLPNTLDVKGAAISDTNGKYATDTIDAALDEIGAYDVLTTRGDLMYRAASAPARLAKGTSGQVLKMGADDPGWATQTEIKTDISAPTDLTITTGAAKTLLLATPVYDDIIISASNLRPGGSAPAFAEFIAPVYAMKFLNGSTDIAYGAFEIPHGYKEGTDLEVHVHWSPSSANTGDCVWKFNAVWAGMGAGAFTAIAEMTATDAGDGVAFAHQYASFGSIAGANHKIGDIIAFELKRPAGDAFTGDAFLLSIGIHYQIDTIGSRSVSAK